MYADTFDQSKDDKHLKASPESPYSGSGSSRGSKTFDQRKDDKHLKASPESPYSGSGSSRGLKTFDQRKDYKHLKALPESPYSGSGSSRGLKTFDQSKDDKHLKASPESPYSGSGSSRGLKTFDQSKHDKHLKACPESTYSGGGSSKGLKTFDPSKDKHFKTCPESPSSGSGSSKHSHSKSKVIDGSGSSTDSEGQIDVIARGETILGGGESIWEPVRSLSSSSTSESSSLNDVFEVVMIDLESKSFIPALKNEQNDVSSDSSSSSEDDNNSSVPPSTYGPPTVSPPGQVMDPSGGYDPNRIRSSIFARNNASPVEWSTASNESLFSIHLGNYSFSRDRVMFDDLYKSGELTKSGELHSQPSFVIPEDVEIEEETVDMEDLQTKNMLDKTFESENRLSEEQNKANNLHPDIICNSLNVSGRYHCRGTSTCSFAFPILIDADRFSAHKADVSPRRPEEEPYVPQKEDASKLAPRSLPRVGIGSGASLCHLVGRGASVVVVVVVKAVYYGISRPYLPHSY